MIYITNTIKFSMNNLIGLSGKIGVGKDLVWDIINFLMQDPENFTPQDSLSSWQQSSSPLDATYKNKKFADKLKEMVCVLLGCTRDQLEDRDFKETPLPEEWWLWRSRFGTLVPYSYVTKEGSLLSFKNPEDTLIQTTPRLLLQLLGTNCGRNIIHPLIWVNSLFSGYTEKDFWTITDVRFPEEVEAIEDRGGVVIRIIRKTSNRSTHPSETSLDNYAFAYLIKNNGTIEELISEVRKVLIKIKNNVL